MFGAILSNKQQNIQIVVLWCKICACALFKMTGKCFLLLFFSVLCRQHGLQQTEERPSRLLKITSAEQQTAQLPAKPHKWSCWESSFRDLGDAEAQSAHLILKLPHFPGLFVQTRFHFQLIKGLLLHTEKIISFCVFKKIHFNISFHCSSWTN